MNTVKSFWLGWGSLIVAGGGAYYFAKRSINADRTAKYEEQRRKKSSMVESLEYSDNVPSRPLSSATMGGGMAMAATSGAPDSAPPRQGPSAEGQDPIVKSKYESSTPFKSRKGDRFS